MIGFAHAPPTAQSSQEVPTSVDGLFFPWQLFLVFPWLYSLLCTKKALLRIPLFRIFTKVPEGLNVLSAQKGEEWLVHWDGKFAYGSVMSIPESSISPA